MPGLDPLRVIRSSSPVLPCAFENNGSRSDEMRHHRKVINSTLEELRLIDILLKNQGAALFEKANPQLAIKDIVLRRCRMVENQGKSEKGVVLSRGLCIRMSLSAGARTDPDQSMDDQ
jgi:hypothetical protein